MDKRPLILITNNDGLGARGLEHLVRIAVRLGDVVVVAPDTPQSGKSSAITVNTPLYVNEHAPIDSAKVFTTSGTLSTALSSRCSPCSTANPIFCYQA